MLFEYDSRFSIFGGDFVQYDYKFPLDVPRDMSSQFDLVIADPPFISDECLTKTAVTIKFLTKKNIVLCTGEIIYFCYFSFFVIYSIVCENDNTLFCMQGLLWRNWQKGCWMLKNVILFRGTRTT